MIMVTYNVKTKEVISVVSLEIISDGCVKVGEQDGIIADGYDYIIYNGTEPLFENKDGKVYLKENKMLLMADYLD